MLGFVVFGLWIFCLLDIITSPAGSCRNLGKSVWLILAFLLPGIGSIVWLVAGRPIADRTAGRRDQGKDRSSWHGHPSTFSDRERPRHCVSSSPDDHEVFLRGVRERAEQQRRAYQAQKRLELGETDPMHDS
ncbi:MAG: PLDc_N domain-containing protein [Flavobacterium sp.]|nr:PLDc_N domain-containing protein [Aeromicrobium sp.]